MIEVEVKLKVAEPKKIEAKLKKLGGRFAEQKRQSDVYFNAPDRDFAKTDEALRIRTEKGNNFLTYKGPKIDTQTKSRREIEILLGNKKRDRDNTRSLLILLGYREVATVNKRRRIFKLHNLRISIDQVDNLGSFIEVEASAEETAFEKKRKQIFALLKKIDLNISKSIRQSYLELLLAKRGESQ